MDGMAGQPPISRRSDTFLTLGLGIGFLGLYLRTLCPTVYLGDSGELCTAIATGGVPHPPGYPLFSLLGRAALVLVPFGEPAFRIGCVAAAAAAAAVAVLYLLGRELDCSRWAAAAGASVFGTCYTFWSQSTRVEVYSLHVLLAALVLLGGVQYRRTGSLRSLSTAILAVSLGLAHHLTIVLLLPALLILCGRRLWGDPRRASRLAVGGALLTIGPALYLMLLIWARTEPLHAWGVTTSLPLLWNHASARIFRIFLEVPTGPQILESLQGCGRLFIDNFPYLLFLLPCVGSVILWRRDRGTGAGLLAVVLVIGAYNCCYQIPDIAGYYLVLWLVAGALLAVTLDAARGAVPVGLRSHLAAGAVTLLLPGALLVRNAPACDLSRATWVREFARHKLENADPGSILITHGDNDINPIWYVHDVLRVRPDVIPLDRTSIGGRTWGLYHLDPSLWYLHRLRRQGVPAPLPATTDAAERGRLARDGYLIRLLERELANRPLCMTFLAPGTEISRWIGQRYTPVPLGIILRLQPRSRPVHLQALLRENERLWARITLPDLNVIRTDQEMSPHYVAGHYAVMLSNLGGLYEMAGDRQRARDLYRRARACAPPSRIGEKAGRNVKARSPKGRDV